MERLRRGRNILKNFFQGGVKRALSGAYGEGINNIRTFLEQDSPTSHKYPFYGFCALASCWGIPFRPDPRIRILTGILLAPLGSVRGPSEN